MRIELWKGRGGRGLASGLLGLVAMGGIGLCAATLPQLFGTWELATYDLRVRWAGTAHAHPAIVLIGRDEESDARFGVGVWDRALFAQVIAGLNQAGARTIALDFHMPAVSPPERGSGASDQSLLAATGSGRVLYPIAVAQSNEDETVPPALSDRLTSLSPQFSQGILQALPRAGRVEGPFPALASLAASLGHIAAWPDVDGVYRRVPSFVAIGAQAVPTLGLAVAASFLHVSPDQIELVPGGSLRLRDARWPDGRHRTISVPVDAEGRLLIRYAGRWTDGPFPYLSFVDVWDAVAEGREAELRELVEGKLVILVHAALGSDKRRTSYDVAAPGGFILANVVNTLLMQQGLREAKASTGWLLALALGVGAAGAMLWWPGWGGPVAAGALGLAYLSGTFVAMGLGSLVLPVLSPLATLVAAVVLALGWTRRHATDLVARLEAEQLALHRVLAAKQELLARQEAKAEGLEEDLDSVKTEVVTGQTQQSDLERRLATMQEALGESCRQAESTRETVQALERRLASLQAATVQSASLAKGETEALQQESEGLGILTRDPAMLRALRDLKKAARSRAPILILGEPGTGKELYAQAAHRLSDRASGPFVPVNMAAVPAELFESELFGHLKGAFTGAMRDKIGSFEQAHRGTLFLDEIGDLRLDLQAKLLRVLQDQRIMRVGDTALRALDVRIVAATNRDLLQGIAQGWFREDLYYRLQGIELRLTPLRERRADIPLLAEALVREAAVPAGRAGLALSQGALDQLCRRTWKGNVRELKHCLEKAVLLAEGELIQEGDLGLQPESVAGLAAAVTAPGTMPGDPRKDDASLLAVLRDQGFDLQATAKTLGWDRSTVMQRMKGLCFEALASRNGDRTMAAADLAGAPGLTRLVEAKLTEYVDHLLATAREFPTADEAVAGCRKRFKNLPERYSAAVETLIRRQAATAR